VLGLTPAGNFGHVVKLLEARERRTHVHAPVAHDFVADFIRFGVKGALFFQFFVFHALSELPTVALVLQHLFQKTCLPENRTHLTAMGVSLDVRFESHPLRIPDLQLFLLPLPVRFSLLQQFHTFHIQLFPFIDPICPPPSLSSPTPPAPIPHSVQILPSVIIQILSILKSQAPAVQPTTQPKIPIPAFHQPWYH
jgi:hypothetical protein